MRDKCCLNCLRERNFIETRNLQVHHIVKRVDDYSKIYDVSNLITLCRTCHDEVEEMPVEVQKEIFKDFIEKDISFSLL